VHQSDVAVDIRNAVIQLTFLRFGLPEAYVVTVVAAMQIFDFPLTFEKVLLAEQELFWESVSEKKERAD